MRKYSPEKISKLKEFRKKGYSIHELMDKFSMPKTTVWHHIKDVKIPKKYRLELKSRQGGSKQKSQNDWRKAKKEAKKLLKNTNKNDLMLLSLINLYWGEGSKRKGFIFTNTDEDMIKVFLKCLREIFKIENERISLRIRIGQKMSSRYCINYWKNVAKISEENIIIDKNRRHNRTKSEYGICRIRIKKGSYLFKVIMSLKEELISKLS